MNLKTFCFKDFTQCVLLPLLMNDCMQYLMSTLQRSSGAMSKNHLSSHISIIIIRKSRKNAYIKYFYNFSKGVIYGIFPQKNSIYFFFLKFPFQISYSSSMGVYQWSSKDRLLWVRQLSIRQPLPFPSTPHRVEERGFSKS